MEKNADDLVTLLNTLFRLVAPAIDHEALDSPHRLVLFHEFAEFREAVDGKIGVEHSEFIHDVPGPSLVQIVN